MDGRTPPEQADGLLRAGTVEVPYAAPDGFELPGTGTDAADDGQRFAVLWCEVGPDDAAISRPSLRLGTTDGGVVDVPCLPEDGAPGGATVTPVPLPPGEGTSLRPTWQGDVPSRGKAVLGIYRESSWSEYDFPGWPDPPLDAPAHGPGTVVIDPRSGSGAVGGISHGDARVATVTLTSESSLELWRGVPGGLEVEVDGVRVTDDGDLGGAAGGEVAPEAWQDADAELRDGAWTAFTAGQRRALPLPPEVLPSPGETRTVMVAVVPRAGAEQWQVAVLGTTEAPDALAPADPAALPEAAEDLPGWHAGHRLVGTWLVPRTGVATALELPEDGLGEDGAPVAWALRCTSAGRDGGVLGTARIVVDDAAVERVCVSDLDAVLSAVGDPAFAELPEVRAGSSVQVAAPPDPEGGQAVVAAYVPVPFEEFDFTAAAAPPGWDPMAAVRGEVAVDQGVGKRDLADGSVTDVALSPGTVGVRVTTEGVGRLRFLVDGAPAGDWDLALDEEGWWTSWTDDRVTAVPVAWVRAPSEGGVLTVEVDGYADGSATLEVLTVEDAG